MTIRGLDVTVCNNKLECATSTPNLHHTPLRQPIHAYNTSPTGFREITNPQPQQNARGSNTLLARLLAPSLSLACPIRVEATAATSAKSTDRRFDWHGSLRRQAGTQRAAVARHSLRSRSPDARGDRSPESESMREKGLCFFYVPSSCYGAKAQLLCWAFFAQVGSR